MATFFTEKARDITTAALAAFASVPKYIGIGTGTGHSATSTALITPVESRATGTVSVVTTTTTNDTLRVVGTITATAARAVTEAATFDASTAGNIFLAGDFSVINLAINDQIEVTADAKYS
jgi:hypothetical protein